MNFNEKAALIDYLEFHLVTFCNQVGPSVDPDAVGDMWDFAYGILNDLERSIEIDEPSKNHSEE